MAEMVDSSTSSVRPVVPRHFAPGMFAVHSEQPTAPIAMSGNHAAFAIDLELEGLPHVGARLACTVRVVVDLARTAFNEDHENPVVPVVASHFSAELDAAVALVSGEDAAYVRDTIEEMAGVAVGRWLLDSARG